MGIKLPTCRNKTFIIVATILHLTWLGMTDFLTSPGLVSHQQLGKMAAAVTGRVAAAWFVWLAAVTCVDAGSNDTGPDNSRLDVSTLLRDFQVSFCFAQGHSISFCLAQGDSGQFLLL